MLSKEGPMRARFAVTMLVGFITALAACEVRRPELRTVSGRLGDPPPGDPPYMSQQGVALEGGNLEGDRLTFPYDSARAPDGGSFVAVYLDSNPDAGTELVAWDGTNEIRGDGLVGVTFDGTTLDGGMYRARIDSY